MNLECMVGKMIEYEYESWMIVKAYPFHVLGIRRTDNGYVLRSCFNVGTLITKGLISSKVAKGFYKHFSNGWGA